MADRKRVALVTGSTGGLGLAIADALAADGHAAVLHGLLDAAAGDKLAGDMAARHSTTVLYRKADLADVQAIEALIRSAEASLGAIGILVNNAVTRHFSPVESFATERWNQALAVNLSAPFHTIRLVLPGMRRAGWGRIVNLASIYSFKGAANRVDYVTTKTAILGMTRAVALEVAGSGISCNAVCPGTLRTPDIEARIAAMAAQRGVSVEAATDDYLSMRQPSRRFISMAAVARLVVHLCGDDAEDINGAALPVDAAWSAA
jgi:3-hydroxybutyrate dehydrogenase